jgi:hypothetical protein
MVVETVNSVIKRKFRDTIRSRIWFLQRCKLQVSKLMRTFARILSA